MGVAHTLFRTFFWSENILWKGDIADKRVTIFLGGRDQVIDTKQVGMYLTDSHDFVDERLDEDELFGLGEGQWTSPNGKLKVVFSEELDHAQIFDSKKRLPGLVDEVLRYSVDAIQS